MRCYHLNNFYLGAIHAGIQSAHAQHELMLKYLDPLNEEAKSPYLEPQRAGYLEWARDHKTIIVVNAGMQSNLEDWVQFLLPVTHSYAWASFHESIEALNGALTNIAVVLPERIYLYSRLISSRRRDPAVGQLYELINDDLTYLQLLSLGGGNWKLVRKVRNDSSEEFVTDIEWLYTSRDMELMSRLSQCSLM